MILCENSVQFLFWYVHKLCSTKGEGWGFLLCQDNEIHGKCITKGMGRSLNNPKSVVYLLDNHGQSL